MTDEGRILKLDNRTLIFDRATQRQVAWIDGVVPLPVGTVIQLGNPNVDAVVATVRFWAAATSTVILDCDVPDAYWNEPRTEKPLLRLV
jgi:hypothetical protein